MFDALVFILINSFWASMICLLILLAYRIIYALKVDMTTSQRVLLIFLPCSIGFYLYSKKTNTHKLYEWLVIAEFILMFIASIYLLYLRLELTII
ncbi:MAG: hypothetical protein RBT45_07835 [Acholeplasmataceae bacterium]|jgi:hypothetical protein|nr:hypothetical protein [Acholeplasmataceae bacterium]